MSEIFLNGTINNEQSIVDIILSIDLVLFHFPVVSGDGGENCGIGNCLDGYHCCSVSTGTCCPGGFFCSGAKCVSLV